MRKSMEYGSIIFAATMIIILFFTRNYEKEEISKLNVKEHKFKILYPFCLFLIDRVGFDLNKNSKKVEQLEAIYVGSDKKQIYRMYHSKKIAFILVILMLCTGFALLLWITDEKLGELVDGYYIYRDSMTQTKEIQLESTFEKGKEQRQKEISLTIRAKTYTEEQYEKKLEEAKEYIKQHFLGDNKEMHEIRYPLNLITEIPDNFIEIEWDLGMEHLVKEDGTLNNRNFSNTSQSTILYVKFYYGDWEDTLDLPITVLQADFTEEEKLDIAFNEALKKAEEESLTKETIKLPKQVNGYHVEYEEKRRNKSEIVLIIGIVVVLLLCLLYDKGLDKKIHKREMEMRVDYPELVNKITMLLSAGMTISRAWERIAKEYQDKVQKGQKRRYAYDEWLITWYELCNGVPEITALERFGRRVKLLNYIKFSSLLSQNLKKGSKGLSSLLEYEAIDALEERKALAKRLGEEASTKLLLPMAMMLILALTIIMIPAFMSF